MGAKLLGAGPAAAPQERLIESQRSAAEEAEPRCAADYPELTAAVPLAPDDTLAPFTQAVDLVWRGTSAHGEFCRGNPQEVNVSHISSRYPLAATHLLLRLAGVGVRRNRPAHV